MTCNLMIHILWLWRFLLSCKVRNWLVSWSWKVLLLALIVINVKFRKAVVISSLGMIVMMNDRLALLRCLKLLVDVLNFFHLLINASLTFVLYKSPILLLILSGSHLTLLNLQHLIILNWLLLKFLIRLSLHLEMRWALSLRLFNSFFLEFYLLNLILVLEALQNFMLALFK